jgi:ABC-type polysaccharide/polyol phosphate export permease
LAKLDLRKRYRRSLLGLGWALLHPIIAAMVLCGIFSGAFNVAFREHFPFVLTGLCFWNYFTWIISQGCGCLYWSETYIRQHRAPMAIYPFRIVLPAAFHFLIAIGPVVVWVWATRGVATLTALEFFLLATALLLILGWSLVTICAFANVYFPDTQQICDAVLQLLLYTTPIFYRPEMLRDRGLHWVVDWNPLAAFAQIIRQPILDGTAPSMVPLGLAVGTVVISFVLAVLVLAKLERNVIFQL